MSQLVCLEKITLIQKRSYFSQKNRASKIFINSLSYKSDNEDSKNSLELNELLARLFKALNARLSKVLPPNTFINIIQYTKKT